MPLRKFAAKWSGPLRSVDVLGVVNILLIVGLVVICVAVGVHFFEKFPPTNSSEVAAWLQAAGTLVSIWVVMVLAILQVGSSSRLAKIQYGLETLRQYDQAIAVLAGARGASATAIEVLKKCLENGATFRASPSQVQQASFILSQAVLLPMPGRAVEQLMQGRYALADLERMITQLHEQQFADNSGVKQTVGNIEANLARAAAELASFRALYSANLQSRLGLRL